MEQRDTSLPQQDQEIKLNEDEIRLTKVKKMQELGINPWPEYKPIDTTTQQARLEYSQNPHEQKEYALAGRLITMRDHGKSFFCNIVDRSGKLQLYIKKDIVSEQVFEFFKNFIDLGDIIWVKGYFFTTKTGEPTVHASQIELLSKCLHALPEKYHGLTDTEQRYRQRYLDLISNDDSREKFKKRSKIVRAVREFLQDKDFIEVETPMLQPIPGGATARPFITHHNAYDIDLYLRIAPELYLKRLVVGGFERVFEINRNFRNEGVSTKHNPEFTMLEFYMAHGDYLDGMNIVEELIANVIKKNFDTYKLPYQDKILDFTPPFKRLTMEQSLIEIGSLTKEQLSTSAIDATMKQHDVEVRAGAGYGVKLFALFEALVESRIVNPTFIMGYPVEVSPLAKRDPNNPELTARFELFINGIELANSFTELNDPFDQASRFQSQAQAREAGDQEAHHFDEDYINALEYALPPTVGVGMGIDRLTMFLTDTTSIKDVILFPTMKIRKEDI